MTTWQTTLSIPSGHSSTRGHFPGKPVIPAAFLLAAITDRLEELHPGLGIIAITKAKFIAPALPGAGYMLDYTLSETGKLRFTLSDSSGRVVEGSLQVRSS